MLIDAKSIGWHIIRMSS